MDSDIISILEDAKVEGKGRVAVVGLPDAGLVGSISVLHLEDKLGFPAVAHVESDRFPPLVPLRGGRPAYPVTIYGDAKMLLFSSEMPLDLHVINEFSRATVSYFREKGVSQVIVLGGVAHPKRIEIDKPRVYGIGTDERADETIKKSGVESFGEGLILGPNGVILRDCMKAGISAVYLIAEAHSRYPDPGAAASVIEALNRMMGLDVDVKVLLEKEDEIKIKTRELMKNTEETMQGIQKKDEESPMMYR